MNDKMDALVNDKQTYEELKRDPTPTLQRNLTVNYLRSRRLTLLTLNATTDWSVQYRNHRNATDNRNYTNLVFRCDL